MSADHRTIAYRLTMTGTFLMSIARVLYISVRVIMIGFGSTVFSSSSSAPNAASSGSTEATEGQLGKITQKARTIQNPIPEWSAF